MSKIILFIAMSKDGFIADKDGGVDWLPHLQDDQELEMVGYKTLMERIGTIAMGRKSFEQISSFSDWAWKDKQSYVFTSKDLKSEQSYITIVNEAPEQFVQMNRDKDVWLLDGAELAQSFAKDYLIDEITLTIVPKILSNGIQLSLNFNDFHLIGEKPPMRDLIQKFYLKKRNAN